MAERHRYAIVVGNIGTVYDGGNRRFALAKFRSYRDQSNASYGRASGETVTMTIDGEPTLEHIGANDQREDN